MTVFDSHGHAVTLGCNDESSINFDTDKRVISPDLHWAFELAEDAFASVSD